METFFKWLENSQVPGNNVEIAPPDPFNSFQMDKKRGEYKQLRDPAHPTLKNYPIEGVTYPTDYGSLPGYIGEDGDDLDVFRGTGNLHGIIQVKRPDAIGGIETKFIINVTSQEHAAIVYAFKPVLANDSELFDHAELLRRLFIFKVDAQI